MPVSVVVGGQYGSEGKGKAALHIARATGAKAVVRVGGPNSGHTGVDSTGETHILRQLPASSLAEQALVVLPAGSLIDASLLLSEIQATKLDKSRLVIDAKATVVLPVHSTKESNDSLVQRIGSTASGTGAALVERISRVTDHQLAGSNPLLQRYCVEDTSSILRDLLDQKDRIVVEGTQGFGLSIWHGGHYPFATSRDTTAASFISEAGLAPHDVDDVVLVIRSYPIRVGGNSGPLPQEIDWEVLASEAGLPSDFREYTSATKRIRRVARFDERVVRRALVVNNPTRVVLNHVDYVGPSMADSRARSFVEHVEELIDRKIDLVGFGPDDLVRRTSHNS